MKLKSLYVLLFVVAACIAGCFDRNPSTAPNVCGIYSFHTSDSSIHHGVDILVINNDSTYVHVYTKGSSGKDLTQSGHWNIDSAASIGFDNFVAWDLFGPTSDGVRYPDPANTALALSQDLTGNYEIDAGPDRGERFVQIERCSR